MSSAVAAVLLAALAGLLAGAPRTSALRRLERDGTVTDDGGRTVRPLPRQLPRVLAGLAAGAALTSHGTAATLLAVLVVMTGVPAARRRRSDELRRGRVSSDLPRAADLLATCLDAGAATSAAVGVVAVAVGGPVGHRLGQVAAALSAGGDPPVGTPGSGADPVDRLVAAVARASTTGAPLAATVRELAVDERDRARWAATERARAAGVQAVGPLAACFLPAFVLVGVVPVVAGVAGSLLRGSG